MHLFSLLTFAVFAAETILSPIPDNTPVVVPLPPKPDVSFGQITTAIPTPTLEATPSPTPTLIQTQKKSYTVAFLGDSMIDTMGSDLPAVQSKLSATYAATDFTLLNYGMGGTNIDDATGRISTFTSPPPDIVVLESCAYNPYPGESGIDRHWSALSNAVETLRSSIPGVKIIVAATIAPNSKVFGDGAPNIAFSTEDKISRTNTIKQYLDSTVQFARSQHLPLADAYHASLDGNGDGILTYINGGDHIHCSDDGRALFAQKVVSAIQPML
jgi:hypothetical protein